MAARVALLKMKEEKNMYSNSDFEGTKKKWKTFWEGGFIGRPLMYISAPKEGVKAPQSRQTYVERVRTLQKGDWTSVLENFSQIVDCHYWEAEAIPFFTSDLAPDSYAAYYGGELVCIDGQNTTWVKPIANSVVGLNPIINKSEGSFYDISKKYLEFATKFAGDKFLISTTDYHTHLDALSCMITPENHCMEMLDCPEEVERVLSVLKADFRGVFEDFYKAGDCENRGSIGWSPTYCEGRFAVIQCDFIYMIGSELARRFAIPAIEEEANYLDHCVYHYDGIGALRHLDDILAIKKIDCIQWVPGPNHRTTEWKDLLKRIQKAGKSLWIGDWTPDEILADKDLDPSKVVFSVYCETKSKAKQLIEALEKKYR